MKTRVQDVEGQPTHEPIRIEIPLAGSPYFALVGRGLIGRAGELCHQIGLRGRCAVIADSNVFPLHGDRLLAGMREAGMEAEPVLFPAGESSKSMNEVSRLLEELAVRKFDRSAFVIALGGGVAGDLAGFVAATFLRGIPVVQVPTTVVAQVDSSVGGKTGVNLTAGKNLAGAFHQPRLVIADTATLDTLPDREFFEGFAEVIKHAAIRDAALLDEVESFDRGQPVERIIARNIGIKAAIVAADERESSGERALLNFGHTIGHAIEKVAGYGRYLHGEAIALGLIAATRLSVRKAGLPAADDERLRAALRRFRLPERLDPMLSPEAILEAAGSDKKFQAGRVRFVLIDRIGSARLSAEVTREEILAEIRALQD